MKKLPEINGVTLLSEEEAEKLPKDILKSSENWWLCSQGFFAYRAAFVYGDYGAVLGDGDYVKDTLGVRPALCISDLESSGLQIGDKFAFGGESWTIVSDEKALCNDIIGRSAFHYDNYVSYESSDVKKFVDEWFEKALEKEYGSELKDIIPVEKESEEWKDYLYHSLSILAEYHEDVAPEETDTLDVLLEKFLYWAEEYNDGYFDERQDAGHDRYCAWLAEQYNIRYGKDKKYQEEKEPGAKEKNMTREVLVRVEVYDDTLISDLEQAVAEGLDGIDCSYEVIDNGYLEEEHDIDLPL